VKPRVVWLTMLPVGSSVPFGNRRLPQASYDSRSDTTPFSSVMTAIEPR